MTSIKPSAILATASAILCSTGQLLAQGELTPPAGVPAPTMKTLDQVEARIPIGSLPFTIDAPGSYYITRSLEVADGDGITIDADSVTLDFNGFGLRSLSGGREGIGVRVSNQRAAVIKNGICSGFLTGIEIDGGHSCRIHQMSFYQHRVGVLITTNLGQASNHQIVECSAESDRPSSSGVTVRAAAEKTITGVGVHHCVIGRHLNSGIGIRNEGGSIRKVDIRECVLSLADPGDSSQGIVVVGSGVSGVDIRNCAVDGAGRQGISVSAGGTRGTSAISIDGCRITNCGSSGIAIRGSSGAGTVSSCTIRDCQIADNGGHGIQVVHTTGSRIEGNHITRRNVGDTGIEVSGSTFGLFVLKNIASGFLVNYDLATATAGPVVTGFGTLDNSGTESHPWANFAP